MPTPLKGAFTVEVHRDHQATISLLRPAIDAASKALKAGEDPLSAVERALQETIPEGGRWERAGARDHECFFSDDVLFPSDSVTELVLNAPGVPAFRAAPTSIPVVADYLRCAVSGEFTQAELADAQPELSDYLGSAGCLEGVESAPPPRDEIGVFRMQHAGLLYQSATTRILVDPHFHSVYSPQYSTVFGVSEFARDIDAVLISHSHSDHFSPGSLLFLPPDTLIIVPFVARASVLCPDLAALLEALGFTNVRTPRWYDEPIVVGDIEVFALPFYGEQPLASEAWPAPEVRNWGNTYYVRTPEFTSFVLIDSGNDPAGRMRDVAEYVRDELGPVDYLLSNLSVFGVGSDGPRYISSNGSYFATLSRSQMRNFASFRGESLTLGPEGVAECCRACDARYFLPYAHWWGPPFVETDQERQLLPRLSARLGADRIRTSIVPLRIGESVVGPVDSAVLASRVSEPNRSVPISTFERKHR